jgi:hypothetical protein
MTKKYNVITDVLYELYEEHYTATAINSPGSTDFEGFLPDDWAEDAFARKCCLCAATLGVSHVVNKVALFTAYEVYIEVKRLLSIEDGLALSDFLPDLETEDAV